MNLLFNKTNLISYTVDTAFDNNFSISIQNGEVVVNAPWYLSKKQIKTIVAEKTYWIQKKLNEYEQKKFLEYKNISLLGKNYKTKIYFKNITSPEVTINNKYIEVLLPNSYKNRNITSVMEYISNQLYTEIANKELEYIIEKVRLMLGIAPENFEIKSIKNTLGYCTSEKNIIINPEIFKYKKEIIEYVVIHEFCHLKYKTHSKGFYNMLKKYSPNYEELSLELHHIQI